MTFQDHVAVSFLFLESANSSVIFQILRFAEDSFCISWSVMIALEANILEKIAAVIKILLAFGITIFALWAFPAF